MSETEKKILETFQRVIPNLNEIQKARLLGIGEGMEIKAEQQERERQSA
ncbi:hypothetical protein [Anaerocolumna chitinilytica]|uniref:Uncharacterized protein n=1 Tax=Anaerocolumna chitinilytica TaxID=1727145 RepID=A0A7M3SA25_9FIRM|nr:hypothetical protein [Anaerocolumna chitinilytica]BCK01443.1 hypothetical protein bsdcttw_44830 [Anaerocolumna chitinilytica]